MAPVGRPHTVHVIPQYDPHLTPVQGNSGVVLRVGIGAYPVQGIPQRQLDISAADLADKINLPGLGRKRQGKGRFAPGCAEHHAVHVGQGSVGRGSYIPKSEARYNTISDI